MVVARLVASDEEELLRRSCVDSMLEAEGDRDRVGLGALIMGMVISLGGELDFR